MRLGILNFGTALPDIAVLDALSERDVDIVRGEAAINDFAGAKTEAERIQRADCDGVALVIGDDAQGMHVAHGAQFLGVPQLLVGNPGDSWFAACGALAEAGFPFDRFSLVPRPSAEGEWRLQRSQEDKDVFARHLQISEVSEWLNGHAKIPRQAGVEAASKLYGQILRVTGKPTVGVDTAQWRQQFGISVVFGDEGEADMVAEDGNPNRALCRHLLYLVSGQEVKTYRLNDPLHYDTTFAQLYRVRGKYHLYTLLRDSRFCIQTDEWPLLAEYHLFDAELYGVPGDFRPALRAACEGLDITFVS